MGFTVTPQRPADPLGCVRHDLWQEMGVFRGHADLRATEGLHHNALVNALSKQERGRGVPGIMDPYPADTSGFEQGIPFVPVGVGADWPPVGLAPDEITVVPVQVRTQTVL